MKEEHDLVRMDPSMRLELNPYDVCPHCGVPLESVANLPVRCDNCNEWIAQEMLETFDTDVDENR